MRGGRNWKWRNWLGGPWKNSAERCSELELGQEEWAGGECQLMTSLEGTGSWMCVFLTVCAQ